MLKRLMLTVILLLAAPALVTASEIRQQDGKVVKWAQAPTIAFVYEDRATYRHFQEIIREIEAATGLTIQIKAYSINPEKSHLIFLDQTEFTHKNRIHVLPQRSSLADSIVVVLSDVDRWIFFAGNQAVTTTFPETDPRMSKRLYDDCISVGNATDGALSFSLSAILKEATALEPCLYTGVMRSFGIDTDATDRARDHLLLRALYDPRIAPGAPVTEVMRLHRDFGGRWSN